MIQLQSLTFNQFSERIKPEVPKAEITIKKSCSEKDESEYGSVKLRKTKKKLRKITIKETAKTTKA